MTQPHPCDELSENDLLDIELRNPGNEDVKLLLAKYRKMRRERRYEGPYRD